MMTSQQIESLIAQGEGYNIEFKQSIPSKASELAEEICAFANAAGGTLLIGIDDKGAVVGVSIDNVSRSRIQNILNAIEPHFPVSFSEVVLHNKTIFCIECESGSQKPYTVSGAIIIRNGPNSEKITSVQRMRDFFQQSDKIFFDEVECKSFIFNEHFDESYFSSFLKSAGISNSLDDNIILQNLKLFSDKQMFKNAAVLFFAKNPQLHFEWATTRCILFKGIDKHHIIDDKIFGGNLLAQFHETLKYIYSKLSVEYIIENSGPRKEVWEIPEVAIKEALVNALVHRDYYEKGARIAVEIFDDRIEITNPGGLVNSIAKSDFGKRSLSRNPLIFGLFQRLHMVEQIGSGISRIRQSIQEAGLVEPYFNLEGMFSVTLYRPFNFEKWIDIYWKEKLNNSQYQILIQIHKNNHISKSNLLSLVGISKTAIDKNINKLKDLGILERIGGDRGGYWKVIKKKSEGG